MPCIEGAEVRQQYLCGTDIGVGFAANVLLTGLRSAIRSAGLPLASMDTLIIRPGIERL